MIVGVTAPLAFTRDISPAIVRCELTHLQRVAIDVHAARAQHASYEQALSAAGCRVQRLAAGDDMPDSVFIEDTAIVFDELAIVARPGAASRRLETSAVADALAPHRPLHEIVAPGTVDGGDVLVCARRVFVGGSGRTNAHASEQMRRILAPFGYTVETLAVTACLHLKSAVCAVADGTLLINREWVDAARLGDFTLIDVDPSEPFAANALPIDGAVIFPREYPRTAARLRAQGFTVHPVPASELAKAEGGVTCCSLILDGPRLPGRGGVAGKPDPTAG
jgi:dimethylargininase